MTDTSQCGSWGGKKREIQWGECSKTQSEKMETFSVFTHSLRVFSTKRYLIDSPESKDFISEARELSTTLHRLPNVVNQGPSPQAQAWRYHGLFYSSMGPVHFFSFSFFFFFFFLSNVVLMTLILSCLSHAKACWRVLIQNVLFILCLKVSATAELIEASL